MRLFNGVRTGILGRSGAVILAAALFLGLAGSAHSQTPSDPNPAEERFDRILILPVYDMRAVYGENFSMQGPLSGEVFAIDVVDPQAAEFVRKTLRSALEQKGTFRLIPATAEDAIAMVGLAPVAGSRRERITAIQRIAGQRGADAVVCTFVYAFRNRVGNAYGVENPAMVSFELNLVSTATGRIVWRRHFTETQKTLNENLLNVGKFLQRKGRWVTAEEMAGQAIEDLLKSFP
ncbi:MAG: hypothetical protein WAU91_08345 [Desulfatitalea sp.]